MQRQQSIRTELMALILLLLLFISTTTMLGPVSAKDPITMRVYHGDSAQDQIYLVECMSAQDYSSGVLQEPGEAHEFNFTPSVISWPGDRGTEFWCIAWRASDQQEMKWTAYKQHDEEDPNRPEIHKCGNEHSSTCMWSINDDGLSYYLDGNWVKGCYGCVGWGYKS